MAEFEVDVTRLKDQSGQIENACDQFGSLCGRIESFHLDMSMQSARIIASSIQKCGAAARNRHTDMKQLASVLSAVASLYQETEGKISGAQQSTQADGSGRNIKDAEDIVFSGDKGKYGGDQGHMSVVYDWNPFKCWDMLKMIREYDPDISIVDAGKLYRKINSVGCGYVAMCNSIMLAYAGREDEFEKTFGFPYYDKDGHPNNDRLLLDMYMTTYKDGLNDSGDKDDMPDSTTPESLQQIMENYLGKHGGDVDTDLYVDMNAQNYDQACAEGKSVIIGVHGVDLQDENGKVYQRIGSDEGHAMNVTGYTEDGRIIVSSWGMKLYIDPSQLDSDDIFMTFKVG